MSLTCTGQVQDAFKLISCALSSKRTDIIDSPQLYIQRTKKSNLVQLKDFHAPHGETRMKKLAPFVGAEFV